MWRAERDDGAGGVRRQSHDNVRLSASQSHESMQHAACKSATVRDTNKLKWKCRWKRSVWHREWNTREIKRAKRAPPLTTMGRYVAVPVGTYTTCARCSSGCTDRRGSIVGPHSRVDWDSQSQQQQHLFGAKASRHHSSSLSDCSAGSIVEWCWFGPCLVYGKMQKVFKISHHIAYIGACMEH
jgi:hypothetical protein